MRLQGDRTVRGDGPQRAILGEEGDMPAANAGQRLACGELYVILRSQMKLTAGIRQRALRRGNCDTVRAFY